MGSKVLPSLKDPRMATFNIENNALGTSKEPPLLPKPRRPPSPRPLLPTLRTPPWSRPPSRPSETRRAPPARPSSSTSVPTTRWTLPRLVAVSGSPSRSSSPPRLSWPPLLPARRELDPSNCPLRSPKPSQLRPKSQRPRKPRLQLSPRLRRPRLQQLSPKLRLQPRKLPRKLLLRRLRRNQQRRLHPRRSKSLTLINQNAP